MLSLHYSNDNPKTLLNRKLSCKTIVEWLMDQTIKLDECFKSNKEDYQESQQQNKDSYDFQLLQDVFK